MKNVRSKSINKKPWLIIASLLVLAGLVVGVLQATHRIYLFGHPRQITAAQKKEAQTNAATKKQLTRSASSKSSDNSTSSEQTTEAATTNPDNVSLTAQQDGSTVTVKTKLIGYSDGSCSLHIINGANLFNQSAQVIYAPEFSTCAGFSVPVSKLGSGTWNISLTVTSKGNDQTKSISVGVQ